MFYCQKNDRKSTQTDVLSQHIVRFWSLLKIRAMNLFWSALLICNYIRDKKDINHVKNVIKKYTIYNFFSKEKKLPWGPPVLDVSIFSIYCPGNGWKVYQNTLHSLEFVCLFNIFKKKHWRVSRLIKSTHKWPNGRKFVYFLSKHYPAICTFEEKGHLPSCTNE